MANLVVVDRSGNERAVEAKDGFSVMEIIRDAGFDQLLAICGGCCSCATCHVYVDPAFAPKLRPMSKDEDELLEGSEHRTATSRLSCQLKFAADLDKMRVTIAPEE